MSQENVELVRELFDAWNRGDREAWLAPAHPEVEWSSAVLRQVEGTGAVHRGRAELARFWDEWHAIWNLEIEVSDIRDLGQTVLVVARLRTQGRSSGAEAEQTVGYLFEFEGALVRRARAYLSSEEALEAAGLSE